VAETTLTFTAIIQIEFSGISKKRQHHQISNLLVNTEVLVTTEDEQTSGAQFFGPAVSTLALIPLLFSSLA
jgi:hypothetical protein